MSDSDRGAGANEHETRDARRATNDRGASSSRGPLELVWRDVAGEHRVALTGRMVVGSGEGVDITIADPTVSRLHAEFETIHDELWLSDLGSRNGTTVDGLSIGRVRMAAGLEVRMGDAALSVRASIGAPPERELWPDETFGPMLGRSRAMRELFASMASVAVTDATVLLHGETGTGKELAARALHDFSLRKHKPFVVLDCGALPSTLLESELFGHARGAFTGAVSAREGAFEAADGGTLFLDEIGELPLAMQPKLLRALESRSVRRLGETQYRAVDVRFVTATHRDLRALVNQGAFREDLYFRLAVVPLSIPPLRARTEDIGLLLERMLPAHARAALTTALLRELAQRPWLGNVRELRNFVERTLALGPARALESEAATEPTSATTPSVAPVSVPGTELSIDPEAPFKPQREAMIDQLERAYFSALLARHRGNVTAAAHAAGIDRTHLHRIMKKHDL